MKRFAITLSVLLSALFTAVNTTAAPLVDLTAAAEKSVNAVVYIKVTVQGKTQRYSVQDPFEDFFGGGYDQYVLSMLSTGQGPVDGNLVPNLDEVDLTGYVTIYEVVNDPAECEKLDEEHLCDKDKTEYIDFFTKQEFLDIISDETLLGRISFNKNDSTDWYVGNGRYWERSVNEEESKHMDWSVDDAYRFSDYTIENIVLTQKLATRMCSILSRTNFSAAER